MQRPQYSALSLLTNLASKYLSYILISYIVYRLIVKVSSVGFCVTESKGAQHIELGVTLSLVHIYACDDAGGSFKTYRICEQMFADCLQCHSYIGGRPGKLT
jgi:hypothetical protein